MDQATPAWIQHVLMHALAVMVSEIDEMRAERKVLRAETKRLRTNLEELDKGWRAAAGAGVKRARTAQLKRKAKEGLSKKKPGDNEGAGKRGTSLPCLSRV